MADKGMNSPQIFPRRQQAVNSTILTEGSLDYIGLVVRGG